MSVWEDVDRIVELPDGRRVRATGIRRPRRGVPAPDLAVYLLRKDPRIAEWPYRWVRWRDFRLPASTDDAISVLQEAHVRAQHERVEIASVGGVGRTGTALALLAVMSGVAPEDTVVCVRANYHPRQWRRDGNGSG